MTRGGRQASAAPDFGPRPGATLESVRAAKAASGREKDVLDVAEIDRIGCDPARHARVAGAYAAMRIACVAHGE